MSEAIELLKKINTTNLRALADWLDMKYKNDPTPQVQTDLRLWADNIDQALAILEKPATEFTQKVTCALLDCRSDEQQLEVSLKLLHEACAILEKQPDEIKRLKERYKEYELLWERADQDNCEGNCDLKPPHKKCPECAAREAINDCSEIRDVALCGF